MISISEPELLFYIKEYQMFFCSGKPHPCERDVDKFLENVKVKLKSKPNVDQHPKCTDDAILLSKLFHNCYIR